MYRERDRDMVQQSEHAHLWMKFAVFIWTWFMAPQTTAAVVISKNTDCTSPQSIIMMKKSEIIVGITKMGQ